MSTSTTTPHATSLTLPTPVAEFFATLAAAGTIIGVREGSGVTVYLNATDESDAQQQGVLLAQRLGEAGLTPAYPARHVGGHWVRVPSYRWEFDTPIYAGDGRWALLVPLTADVDHLLNTVTGLGSYPRDYAGQPVLPVTLYPEDAADLLTLVREIEDDLGAWFGEPVHLAAPNQP